MQADVDAHLVIERVPGVGTPGVRTGRALEPAQVIAVDEAVVAALVRAEIGIVVLGAERSGAPLCQRPTIFAPSSASSSRLAALARRYCR